MEGGQLRLEREGGAPGGAGGLAAVSRDVCKKGVGLHWRVR
jgi:hypothetical protein